MGMGAEVAEAAGEAAKMRAGLPASAAAWLAGMHDAERDALRPDTHDDADDEVRLTASAHALGLEPGANLEQSDVHARYVALAQQLHACREVGEAKTEALQRLHSAGAFLQAYLKGKKGVRAPHRLPPLTPQGVARERLPLPPPSEPEPSLAAVRQVPPALRAWLATYVLGEDAGEALTSPLTYTHGIFKHAPTLHERALGAARGVAEWGWAEEAVSTAAWRSTPWQHSVLVTIDELDAGCTAALFDKAVLSAECRSPS